jgi:hypothetical protein
MITTVDGLRYGQLIKSIAGRDCHQYYLIIALVGDKYLYLVDGLHHGTTNPKKKNIKHVKVLMLVDKDIEELVLQGAIVSDSEIIKTLRKMKNELEEGGSVSWENKTSLKLKEP